MVRRGRILMFVPGDPDKNRTKARNGANVMRPISSAFMPHRWYGAVLGSALLLGLCGPALADTSDSVPRSPIPAKSAVHPLSLSHGAATLPIAASNWLSEMMNKLESWLNNRSHMIQFCAIAMVIGLLIIWWRKT
jgi:hypothetical protein